MGKKNRSKNKKKPVALSLSQFSEKFGVELFQENNVLGLPTGPSGIIIPSSPKKNEEHLKKDNWRGSNVPSGRDVAVESKADTETNWRKNIPMKSNIQERSNSSENKADNDFNWRRTNNSYIPPNSSISRASKFTTNNSSNNKYVPSNKFSLNKNRDSSISTNTSKFSFRNQERKNVFIPSKRFTILNKTEEKNSSGSKQFTNWQESLNEKQSSLIEESVNRKKIQDEYNRKFNYIFEKKTEPKNIPNIPDDKNVKVFKKEYASQLTSNNNINKKNKKNKKNKDNGFFLTELTQEEKEMLKESLRSYEDEDNEVDENEDEYQDEDFDDYDDNNSRDYYGFEPKYI